jgi:hypothetical protein
VQGYKVIYKLKKAEKNVMREVRAS